MDDSDFSLHPTLGADCHVLGSLPASLLLLHRNARLHWFICVPRSSALDLLDMPPTALSALMHDAASVSRFLKEDLAYPRVNVGALGLVVPQLHLHVIGRRTGDDCWPHPVWGKLPAGDEEYDGVALEKIRRMLPLH